MTEPNAPRPVPGPPRPGPGSAPSSAPPADTGAADAGPETRPTFADLDERPVADHVAVYEAEHSRLQRELGTIDQL
jgi:hypothetical protein